MFWRLGRLGMRLRKRALKHDYGSSISLGPDVEFRKGFTVHIENVGSARLSIGEGTFFNDYCSINCLDRVEIGAHCQFGQGVKVYDHDHKFDSAGVRRYEYVTKPVKIGDGCWLGSDVIVLKGVEVGANTIVAAGTILTKSVPPNSIVRNDLPLVVTPR